MTIGEAPSAAAIERARVIAGAGATVRRKVVLAGGTHARTCLIQTANPERDFVLREFPPDDPAVADEMLVLAALDGLGGLAPRLLAANAANAANGGAADAYGGAADAAGSARGPWILTSRLPGVADINPADPSGVARQLGQCLANVHATAANRLAGFPRVFDRPAESRRELRGPAAGLVSARWEALAAEPNVLTHYDFWSGNTLWRNGTLAGVVDWSGAALGPRGFDLGWCRLDLYLMFGRRIADVFLESYQSASGAACTEPLLADLWAVARSHSGVESWVPNYRDLGRPDLTAQVLRERHAAWTRDLISAAAAARPSAGTPEGC